MSSSPTLDIPSQACGRTLAYIGSTAERHSGWRRLDFEVGRTYCIPNGGKLDLENNCGFGTFDNPLDALHFFPLLTSRFAIVAVDGEGVPHHCNRIQVYAEFTVLQELTLTEMIHRAAAWAIAHPKNVQADATKQLHAINMHNFADAATAEQRANAAVTGLAAHAMTTDPCSHATTSGRFSWAATTAEQSHAATCGDDSAVVTIGACAHAATMGRDSCATTFSTGSHAMTSGETADAVVHGRNAIACALGEDSAASAIEGSWIVLAARDDAGNITAIRSSRVGRNGIKPGIKYRLNATGGFEPMTEEQGKSDEPCSSLDARSSTAWSCFTRLFYLLKSRKSCRSSAS